MAVSKKKAPTTKKAAPRKKAARRRNKTMGTRQIDAGWYHMLQNGKLTAQVVVEGKQSSSVEYYYLYVSTAEAGEAAYTWPSATDRSVATTYVYKGNYPIGWSAPEDYLASLAPRSVKLVTATCKMT